MKDTVIAKRNQKIKYKKVERVDKKGKQKTISWNTHSKKSQFKEVNRKKTKANSTQSLKGFQYRKINHK